MSRNFELLKQLEIEVDQANPLRTETDCYCRQTNLLGRGCASLRGGDCASGADRLSVGNSNDPRAESFSAGLTTKMAAALFAQMLPGPLLPSATNRFAWSMLIYVYSVSPVSSVSTGRFHFPPLLLFAIAAFTSRATSG